jgi:hypothetical protein
VGLQAIPDRALARLSMALLGLLLAANGALLLHDGAGRYTKEFVTESFTPESSTCSQSAGADGTTGNPCSGTPFYRYGHDVRHYSVRGIALMAAGGLGLLLGVFLLVYQLVRWAPERAGRSFEPPVPKGADASPEPPGPVQT